LIFYTFPLVLTPLLMFLVFTSAVFSKWWSFIFLLAMRNLVYPIIKVNKVIDKSLKSCIISRYPQRVRYLIGAVKR
ncbi:MAG: hypothetical protein ACK4K4_06120, partial [Caldimicrobium sp.]